MGERGQADGSADGMVEAAIRQLMLEFPHSSVSMGPLKDGFRPVSSAWDAQIGEIHAYLAYQSRFAKGMDPRTQAAHLIASYAHHFSIVVGYLYLATGRVADMDPQNVSIRFAVPKEPVSGLPVDAQRFQFLLAGTFMPVVDTGLGAFHDAFVSHLRLVIAGLKRRAGLSSAAQWRLAADSLAGAFLDVGRGLDRENDAIEFVLGLIGRKGSPLASPDLRFETIEAVVGGRRMQRIFRLRGGCCLFYRTEGGSFCDSCVLLDAETRRARLRAFMEDTGSS